VAVPAVGRIGQLAQAVGARGDVGAASVRVPPLRLDSAIVKPVPPRTGSAVDRIDSIAASGGASARSRAANSATASASPSTSTTTPPSSLPPNRSAAAPTR
jgi:hypothetical protein